MTIKLEAGKYYITRNGDEVYCVGKSPYPSDSGDDWICVARGGRKDWYFENGNWMTLMQEERHLHDIIRERKKI